MASNKGKCQVCPKFSDSRCSWCKLVFYCSKEHQKQDWPHHKETCTKKKYRVEENDQLGRHLVATEDIKSDHILFKDKPLVLSYKLDTLEYTGNAICVGCYKEIPLVSQRGQKRRHDQGSQRIRRAEFSPDALEKMLVGWGKHEQESGVQFENNEKDDDNVKEQKEKDNDENSSRIVSKDDQSRGDDGRGEEDDKDDDDNETDEYDNSNDEDNDEPEKNVCLSCRLPICSPACSSNYFHKQLECRLLREACEARSQLQEIQKNPDPLSPQTGSLVKQPSGETVGHTGEQVGTTPGKKTVSFPVAQVATTIGPSSSSPRLCCESNSGSNQAFNSPGTTCSTPNNKTSCDSAYVSAPGNPPPNVNIIATISSGIRETLLRNLLYFRCLLLKHVNEGHWSELMSLQSNEEARRSDVTSLEKSSRIFSLIKKTLGEIKHPAWNTVQKQDVHKLVGIIELNALDINISENVEVTGIFPTFSLLEHSCIPSVRFYLVPCQPSLSSPSEEKVGEKRGKASKSSGHHLFELYCRSAVKLKSGDHLSVAYTNAMWNTDKRREFLKKEKHFWCECRRCTSGDELGSNFSTLLCPLPDCKACMVPTPAEKVGGAGKANGNKNNNGSNISSASPTEILWKCTSAKCGKTCAGWQVKKVDTKLCEMVGKAKPSIESYKECLAKMEELVHPDYYLCCIVTHSLIQMYGHDTCSVHEKALLEEKIALCNKLLAVIKKLDPGLALLNIYASVVFYEMHSAILAMAGAEVDEDYHILRSNPETVNLAKVYLQRCLECFKYEFFQLPENKLKVLATKKMEYLNLVMNRR